MKELKIRKGSKFICIRSGIELEIEILDVYVVIDPFIGPEWFVKLSRQWFHDREEKPHEVMTLDFNTLKLQLKYWKEQAK